jgi:RNA polymerase sigma-70 factor (ECF subfamily)
MMPETSDEALMLAYARGEIAAFDRLYTRHRGPLFRFLQRGLGNAALAEEGFQDTWRRVIEARARWEPNAKFSTWLYQIAHNLMIDQYRRARPEVSIDQSPGVLDHRASKTSEPEHVLGEFEQKRRLQRALAELPEDQRLAVQLRLDQEMPLEEIATITGVGRETVKSRLRYALDKLRSRLGS